MHCYGEQLGLRKDPHTEHVRLQSTERGKNHVQIGVDKTDTS